MHQQRRAARNQLRQRRAKILFRHIRKFPHAARHQKTFEPEYSRLPQGREFGAVSRNYAAPKTRVYAELSRRCGDLFPICGRIRNGGYAVERHFDDRSDAAGRRGASGCREPLPILPAGFIDVDVRIDETWHDD